jgi:hypothetical protein
MARGSAHDAIPPVDGQDDTVEVIVLRAGGEDRERTARIVVVTPAAWALERADRLAAVGLAVEAALAEAMPGA